MDTINSKRYEWTLVTLFFFAWGFVFLDRLAISFLIPVIQPILNLTNTNIGQIGLVTTGCYAVSAIVFGALADKSGTPKRWLVIFLLATAITSGMSALSQTVGQLLFIRALVGISEGPVLPLMMVIISNISSENQFGRNAGIINMGVALIAVTLGPVLVTQIVAVTSWQMAFLLAALPSFILALLVIPFTKEITINPEQKAATDKMNMASFFELFKYRNIRICSIVAIMGMSGFWTLMLYAPTYLVNIGHTSMQTMGFIASAMGIGSIIYAVLIPKLSDIFGRKPILTIFLILSAMVPLTMYLFPGTAISTGAYILFGGILGCVAVLWYTLIPMESVPDNLKTTSNGFMLGIGEIIGGAIFPVVAGSIADAKGLPFMMVVAAILLLIGIVASFAITETHPRHAQS